MKKKLISLIISILLLLTSINLSIAHPGRTDANGGHYVRTSGWGYPVGSYHYHNGGSSSGSSGYTAPKKSAKKSTSKTKKNMVQKKIIIAVDKAVVKDYPDIWAYDIGAHTYGFEIKDLGSISDWHIVNYEGSTGYISKTLTVSYTVINQKQICIRCDKGYMFYSPNSNSKTKTSFTKGTSLKAVGQVGNWYYVVKYETAEKPVLGFISKIVAW